MRTTLVTLAVLGSVLTGTGMQPAQATTAPSGDCTQAYRHPHSEVAQDCREAGWTIRPRLVVGPHGVVRMSRLPHCPYEDGSGTASACTWNVGNGIDGNGIGLAYWIGNGNRDRTHYVWNRNPVVGNRWQWVSRSLGDALAEGGTPHASTRNWEQCIVKYGPTTRITCPDGKHWTS